MTGDVRTDYSSGGRRRLAAAGLRHQPPPIPPCELWPFVTAPQLGRAQDRCRTCADGMEIVNRHQDGGGSHVHGRQTAPVQPEPVTAHGSDACDKGLHCWESRGPDDLLGVNEWHGGRYWSLVQLTGLLRSYQIGAGRRGCCTYLLYLRRNTAMLFSPGTCAGREGVNLHGVSTPSATVLHGHGLGWRLLQDWIPALGTCLAHRQPGGDDHGRAS